MTNYLDCQFEEIETIANTYDEAPLGSFSFELLLLKHQLSNRVTTLSNDGIAKLNSDLFISIIDKYLSENYNRNEFRF